MAKMTNDQPQFPLTITFADGSTEIVETQEELRLDIEWLDTDDQEEPVRVLDKQGRQVRIKLRFLTLEALELDPAGDS